MLVALTGVLEDGTNRSKLVPANPRRTLSLPKGVSATVRVKVVTANGVLIDLTGIDTQLVLTVRQRPTTDYPSLIARLGTPTADFGVVDFVLVPDDTRNMEPGRFMYDIWLTKAQARNPIVPTSPFVLEPSVAGVVSIGNLPPPPPVPSGPSSNLGTYAGDALSIPLRSVVYLSSSDTVMLADADDPGKQPVIGFVQGAPSAVSLVVQYSGELGGFVGLIPGATYYLSQTPGGIVDDVSGYPLGAVVQRLGFAKDASTLVIMVDRDFTVL